MCGKPPGYGRRTKNCFKTTSPSTCFFKYGNLQYRLMVKFKILPEVVLIWIHFRALPTLLCFGKQSDPISIRNDTYTNTFAFRNKRSKDNIEHAHFFWSMQDLASIPVHRVFCHQQQMSGVMYLSNTIQPHPEIDLPYGPTAYTKLRWQWKIH